MIILADTAFLKSNFGDFDNDQISWNIAQRWPFVFAFHGKIFFFLRTQDDSKNTK